MAQRATTFTSARDDLAATLGHIVYPTMTPVDRPSTGHASGS